MSMNVFRYQHRVPYAECTIGNHVYYSRYLDLLEAARGEFFRHLGTTFVEFQERGLTFPVIECHVKYKGQAHYDDVLTVEIWISLAGGVRLNFAHRILNQHGALLLEARTCHACTSPEGKPNRLPKELCSLLQQYLHPAEN